MVARSKNLLTAICVLLLGVLACGAPAAATESVHQEPLEPATSLPETVAADSTPFASVTADTECRAGPGLEYDVVEGLEAGTSYMVLEKYTLAGADYWIVQLEDGRKCWLWEESTNVAGKVDDLPEATAPSTPTPPGPLAIIKVTVWGPVLGSIEEEKLSDATVELVEWQENGSLLAVGKSAKEMETGVYHLIDVPSGERMIRVIKDSNYAIGYETINVVIRTEPNEVAIHMDWSSPILTGCAHLTDPLERMRCYNQNQVAPIGTGVFQRDFLLAPTATATP